MYGQVYEILNAVTHDVYIGQTVKKIETRLDEHFGYAEEGDERRFYRAIRKYGKENFSIRAIGQALDKKSLDILEIYYIAFYRQLLGREHVYNIADGGEGGGEWNRGRKASKKTRELQRQAKVGKSLTVEHVAKIKKAKAENPYHLTKEQKAVVGKRFAGIPKTAEHKAHLSYPYGPHDEPRTAEYRAKQSKNQSGRICICNLDLKINKRIKPEELQKYLDLGYQQGTLPKSIEARANIKKAWILRKQRKLENLNKTQINTLC